VTEPHAPGLTTVLPADADLELRAHCATCDDGPDNKPSNRRLVKDLESIDPKDSTIRWARNTQIVYVAAERRGVQ
jgi:hypothetical protein